MSEARGAKVRTRRSSGESLSSSKHASSNGAGDGPLAVGVPPPRTTVHNKLIVKTPVQDNIPFANEAYKNRVAQLQLQRERLPRGDHRDPSKSGAGAGVGAGAGAGAGAGTSVMTAGAGPSAAPNSGPDAVKGECEDGKPEKSRCEERRRQRERLERERAARQEAARKERQKEAMLAAVEAIATIKRDEWQVGQRNEQGTSVSKHEHEHDHEHELEHEPDFEHDYGFDSDSEQETHRMVGLVPGRPGGLDGIDESDDQGDQSGDEEEEERELADAVDDEDDDDDDDDEDDDNFALDEEAAKQLRRLTAHLDLEQESEPELAPELDDELDMAPQNRLSRSYLRPHLDTVCRETVQRHRLDLSPVWKSDSDSETDTEPVRQRELQREREREQERVTQQQHQQQQAQEREQERERERERMEAAIINANRSVDQKLPKDGASFLALQQSEMRRIMEQANRVDGYMQIVERLPGSHDDVLGILRTAVGQARLLCEKKLRQFADLCNFNIEKNTRYVTSIEDLQGYWDLVHIEIARVDTMFRDIETMKANNWRKDRIGPPGMRPKVRPPKEIKPKVLCRPETITAAAAAERERRLKELQSHAAASLTDERTIRNANVNGRAPPSTARIARTVRSMNEPSKTVASIASMGVVADDESRPCAGPARRAREPIVRSTRTTAARIAATRALLSGRMGNNK